MDNTLVNPVMRQRLCDVLVQVGMSQVSITKPDKDWYVTIYVHDGILGQSIDLYCTHTVEGALGVLCGTLFGRVVDNKLTEAHKQERSIQENSLYNTVNIHHLLNVLDICGITDEHIKPNNYGITIRVPDKSYLTIFYVVEFLVAIEMIICHISSEETKLRLFNYIEHWKQTNN